MSEEGEVILDFNSFERRRTARKISREITDMLFFIPLQCASYIDASLGLQKKMQQEKTETHETVYFTTAKRLIRGK